MTAPVEPAAKRRLLLVSYAFPPVLAAESIMVLKKVRVLARHFAITVVTLDNTRGPFPQDEALEAYVPAGVEVVRVPACDSRRPIHRAADLALRVLFRGSELIRYFDRRWAANASATVVERVLPARSFDVLMTNAQSMSAHLVGRRIRRESAIPWAQHYSDPFLEAAFSRGHRLSSLIDERSIRGFLSDVQLITMPTTEMADCTFDHLPAGERESLRRRTAVVPHTWDRQLMDDALARHGDEATHFEDRRLVHVCYVGNLYGVRGGDLLVRVARRLRTEDGRRIAVHVFGRADRRSTRRLAGSDLIFHGGTDYLESLAVMQRADALLMIDVPRARSPFFPSKLADYLGTDRPIIVVADPESAVARIARETELTLAAWDDRPIVFSATPVAHASATRAEYLNSDESLAPLLRGLNRLAGESPAADSSDGAACSPSVADGGLRG